MESDFVSKAQSNKNVSYAFLDLPLYPESVELEIFDNFEKKDDFGYIHGYEVAKVATGCCDSLNFNQCDSLNFNQYDKAIFSLDEPTHYLNNILIKKNKKPVLINMSFGMYLFKYDTKTKKYITRPNPKTKKEERIPEQWNVAAKYAKNAWKREYKDFIIRIAKALAPYQGKDFIVTKSAGNNGCPFLDEEILDSLKYIDNKLTEILDNHLIFVSAYDEYENDWEYNENKELVLQKQRVNVDNTYSDRPKNHNEWVTTVDISNLDYDNKLSMDGTSFAAPRALCFIGKIINDYKITAAETMQAVKEVTRENAAKNGRVKTGELVLDELEKKVRDRFCLKKLIKDYKLTETQVQQLEQLAKINFCDESFDCEALASMVKLLKERGHESHNIPLVKIEGFSEIGDIIDVKINDFLSRKETEITTYDFDIGKYEITQAEWKKIMGKDNNPSHFSGCDLCPVENVSYEDVQEFIEKLNKKTNKKYRLPTYWELYFVAAGGEKAEAEYQNRFRNATRTTTGNEWVQFYVDRADINDMGGWFAENSCERTHIVGTNKPNVLGVYDILGNVSEMYEPQTKGFEGMNLSPFGGSYDISPFASDLKNIFSENAELKAAAPNKGFRLVWESTKNKKQ
jgi:formylglycine-generating enzyme required for sulfatase activity